MAIDLNTIKKMPFRTKIAIVIVAFCLIGAVYWFNFLQGTVDKRTDLKVKLEEMKEKIEGKNKVADQIKQIQADVASLKDRYKTALLKLPDQREIPNLFHSIASEGRDAGITFILFEPKASIPKMLDKAKEKTAAAAAAAKPSAQQQSEQAKNLPPEIAKIVESRRGASSGGSAEPFYEEIPVAVSVTGTFQNTLFFFDKLAKLPRIVNVSDITMNRVDSKEDAKGKNLVTSNCTIKTYMFIEKKEKPVEKPGEKPVEKPGEKPDEKK
jgi:type IV pilus assembly protein PilO